MATVPHWENPDKPRNRNYHYPHTNMFVPSGSRFFLRGCNLAEVQLLPVTLYLNIYLYTVSLQVAQPPLLRSGSRHVTQSDPPASVHYTVCSQYLLNNNLHTTLTLDNNETPQSGPRVAFQRGVLGPEARLQQFAFEVAPGISLHSPKAYKIVVKHIQWSYSRRRGAEAACI